jgi:hypothetical protein
LPHLWNLLWKVEGNIYEEAFMFFLDFRHTRRARTQRSPKPAPQRHLTIENLEQRQLLSASTATLLSPGGQLLHQLRRQLRWEFRWWHNVNIYGQAGVVNYYTMGSDGLKFQLSLLGQWTRVSREKPMKIALAFLVRTGRRRQRSLSRLPR